MDGAAKPPSQFPLGIFFAIFVPVFTLIFGGCVVFTMIAPKSYLGVARIEVLENTAGDKPGRTRGNYDLTKTAAEVITSELVLRKVIASLNLNEVWGKKYFNGEMLKTRESLDILQKRLMAMPVDETTIIWVGIYDDNPDEAAITANSVASAYISYASTNSSELKVQLLDSAKPNEQPVRPRTSRILSLGALAGIGCGLIFGLATAMVFQRKEPSA